jgi:hypothetical protein
MAGKEPSPRERLWFKDPQTAKWRVFDTPELEAEGDEFHARVGVASRDGEV